MRCEPQGRGPLGSYTGIDIGFMKLSLETIIVFRILMVHRHRVKRLGIKQTRVKRHRVKRPGVKRHRVKRQTVKNATKGKTTKGKNGKKYFIYIFYFQG